jgi:hypothetical protein
MAVVYSIRDWDEHFECSQSRKVRKALTWVSTPCKHDGKSFRRLMLMQDGVEIYGTWILIVQVAAKCPTRGVLADSDGPLTAEDLAIKTGCPIEKFDKALKVLSSQQIGWITVERREGSGSVLPTPTNQQTGQTGPTNQPPYPPQDTSPAPNAVPQAGGLAGGRVFDLTWEGVGKRLASIGLVQWPKAVQDAQACGNDPQRCHQLIDFAQRHKFGPGAIAKRFAIASPELGVNSGWPDSQHPETVLETRLKAEAVKRAQHAAESADQEAWRLIKTGRAAGKSDDEIKAECEAAGLPWPNPARVERAKARSV